MFGTPLMHHPVTPKTVTVHTHAHITAKTDVLFQQSVWLLQFCDYLYYANFVNAVLEKNPYSKRDQPPTKCFVSSVLSLRKDNHTIGVITTIV